MRGYVFGSVRFGLNALCILFATVQIAAGSEPAKDTTKSPQYKHGDLTVPGASADEPLASSVSKTAADKHLLDAATAWSGQRNCVSCHTNGSYLFIRPELTESLGPPDRNIHKFFTDQLTSLKKLGTENLQRNTRPAQVVYIAAGLAQWDRHVTGDLSAETSTALELMFALQQESGTWKSLDCWPPLESSAFQEATMAAMAMHAAPGWLEQVSPETKPHVERLLKYLRETPAPHFYGEVLRLWVSLRLDNLQSTEKQQKSIEKLIRLQHSDGSWSLRDFAKPEAWGSGIRAKKLRAEPDAQNPAGDGHMTGLATVILQEADRTPEIEKAIRRGIGWLKTNQRESGRWWTRSLNTDNYHFITYSGTAYALLALDRFDKESLTVSQRR